jgi:putative membrane protein
MDNMMLRDAILAYGHFFAIIATAATLAVEAVLCRPGFNRATANLLGRIDLFYFGAAILALATGFLRLFFGVKGSAFYLQNPVFYAKVGLFVVIALISISPTLRFIRWGRQAAADPDQPIAHDEVRQAARFIYVELGLLALLPLLATLMARGFGY